MDFTSYAQAAAELASTDLTDLAGLEAHLESRSWLIEHVSPQDLAPLRSVQRELNLLVDASAAGEGAEVVRVLNDLLSKHPIRPRVSGHDESTWHLHVNAENATVAETLITESLFGLAILVSENGATKLGRCAAEGCTDAFLDTSANASRRFCGQRCATRTNVAALRRRRAARAAEGFPHV